MPIFVYRCGCGHRFERLVPRDAQAPACPDCGSETRKVPAGPSLGRLGNGNPARTDRARTGVPIPWQGVASGGSEKMQREVAFRERLAAKAVGGLRVPGGPDSHPDKSSGGSAGSGAPTSSPVSD
jgi:putative FmdB family regulatory protein